MGLAIMSDTKPKYFVILLAHFGCFFTYKSPCLRKQVPQADAFRVARMRTISRNRKGKGSGPRTIPMGPAPVGK